MSQQTNVPTGFNPVAESVNRVMYPVPDGKDSNKSAFAWLIDTIQHTTAAKAACMAGLQSEYDKAYSAYHSVSNLVLRAFLDSVATTAANSPVFETEKGKRSQSQKDCNTLLSWFDDYCNVTLLSSSSLLEGVRNTMRTYRANIEASRLCELRKYAESNGLDVATVEKLVAAGLIKLSAVDGIDTTTAAIVEESESAKDAADNSALCDIFNAEKAESELTPDEKEKADKKADAIATAEKAVTDAQNALVALPKDAPKAKLSAAKGKLTKAQKALEIAKAM